MRGWLVVMLVVGLGCEPPGLSPPPQSPRPTPIEVPVPRTESQPVSLGTLDDRLTDWVFDGGQLEFDLYPNGNRVFQVARNRFATPIVIRWSLVNLDNLQPLGHTEGVAFLPAAPVPYG